MFGIKWPYSSKIAGFTVKIVSNIEKNAYFVTLIEYCTMFKEGSIMANICLVCDKRPRTANKVSRAHNITKRWVYPNVHVTRFKLKGQRSIKRGAVCTKCVKAGKIEKVI